MNEKIGYLNVFFQNEPGSIPPFLWGRIAENIPALVFVYDLGRRTILYGNHSFLSRTGVSSAALNSGDVFETIFHPDDIAPLEQVALSIARTGDPEAECVARLRDSNGIYRYLRLTGKCLSEKPESEIQLVLFIGHDMSEALKSKEEIETTRELLEETEELLQFGSWAWDVTTDTVTWTSGLYSLLEYDVDSLNEKITLDFYLSHVLEEYSQGFREMIDLALQEKRDFSFEYVIRTHNGNLKNISTKGKLVKDDTGTVQKVLCINRDITALRSFEKEQERNIRELNRSNRDLEEFAYIASHDLQEPLRKISMFTERLRAKYENGLDKEGELFIERVLASASNMRTLIDNLLDFSRANRRSSSLDQVNLQSVLDGVISELELKIEETKAQIHFSGNFPTIEAATSEMAQLFSNILSNAIKFRKSDGVAEIRVQAGKLSKTERHVLGLAANQTFYKIEIQDNGIGFEPEYAEKIFQIFQRLNGKSEYPGSGIGLAICKKIVEKHNGLIFAKSQPDEGALFTIILPEKQF